MKFALGEIVIMVGGPANGAEAVVTELYPNSRWTGEQKDYRVTIQGYRNPSHHNGWCCMESSLRKKHPPEEDIDWVEKLALKLPKKEKVT